MKILRLASIGFLLQLFGIAAFIAVSRTSMATLGKPAVIGIVAILVILVIWTGFKAISLRGSLFYLPALLAAGYVVAFHFLGITAFPGLLRDWDLSRSYFFSVFRVAVVAFALFVATAILLLLLKRVVSS
ncbi:MAG TPA: hypothetical protein VJP80_08745 [Candidatus Saccharimonadales bacterium]|nr:hypothetical protein [Candidatus Saccharimonadales bacterium]